ncbi:hypothetical protein R69608_01398 [Paraburkholderia nemoris]|nr:hypothetical protein R69608_01398 [Paraburkholderia nemoris]
MTIMTSTQLVALWVVLLPLSYRLVCWVCRQSPHPHSKKW